MGRGRGKGKKPSALARDDINESGEDEKMPAKRRGRPQKPMKDEIEDDDGVEKIEVEEDGNDKETKSSEMNKDSKNEGALENGKKRKRPSQVKENDLGIETNANVLIKPVGFRQLGSRRKNKPRRAAEVGVECK